jgi:RNA polymerase sigma factor (sigma-70 family)
MDSMDEQELQAEIDLATRGDRDALQRLIVHYHEPLRAKVAAGIDAASARRLDAADVLQQAYVSAFKALSNQHREPAESINDRQKAASSSPHFGGPGGLYKWLEQIALNELKNQRRALGQQKRDIRREVHDPRDSRASYPDLVQRIAVSESTPSRRIARDEAIAAVMSSLARLSDEQRDVVRLRFLEGRTVRDVAEQLGKTDTAVHAACYRGLKSLRESMVSITRFLTGL